MNEMYNRIESLCKGRGINVTQMCREADIPRGNLTDLKMGRTAALSTKSLRKISSYFGVSMNFLLGDFKNEEPIKFTIQTAELIDGLKKTPVLTEKDRRDVAREVDRIMADLSESGDLMFDGVPMSDEARAAMSAAMRIGLEEARRRNKETYTPKKHKKG